MAKKKEAAGKTQASRRKVQERPQEIQELQKEVKEAVQKFVEDAAPFDICIVFNEGDNLEDVAYRLTGRHHMYFKVCDYSGVNPCDVKPGTVLKWRF